MQEKTPKSFEYFIEFSGFSENSSKAKKNIRLIIFDSIIVLSIEDMQNLLQVRQHKIMPIYPNEVLNFFLKAQKKTSLLQPIETRNIDFMFFDCRSENKDVCLPKTCHLPLNLESKQVYI